MSTHINHVGVYIDNHKEMTLHADAVNISKIVHDFMADDIEDVDAETISSETKKRGPREQKLFLDEDIAAQEKQRLLDFLHLHKKASSDFDSSEENTCNQIAVCFFRQWTKRQLLNERAGGTAFVRFLRDDCQLSTSVEEKALANVLSRMISSTNTYSDWSGEVSAYFQK